MKLIACIALLAATAPFFDGGLTAFAQDKQDPPMPKPGKEHELLKQFEGKWDITGKFFMAPDAPPMDIKGTETCKVEMNGFWLRGHFKGEFLGKPFEGRSILGYSPAKKKYVGSW